jgi:hydroxymethylglutaryl-CoA synthase
MCTRCWDYPLNAGYLKIKHACYGAMAGLTAAVNYILSGRAKGRKVLVIASDIARYGKDTAGEPTQGAGAVAMLVSVSAAFVGN